VTLREGAGAPGYTSLIAPILPTSRSRRLHMRGGRCVAVFAELSDAGWLVPLTAFGGGLAPQVSSIPPP
jgi:hypothetical protein